MVSFFHKMKKGGEGIRSHLEIHDYIRPEKELL